jgi:aminoglycoside 6'-N-acetyltransferase
MTLIAQRGDLVIRRMLDAPQDYQRLADWCNQPHVRPWWDPDEAPLTAETAAAAYGPDTKPDSPSIAGIIELRGRPVGFIQFYPWEAYEEEAQSIGLPPSDGAWGLDVLVGDPDLIDHGIGSEAVDLLCEHLFDVLDASSVRLVAAIDNARALRAYDKVGFRRAMRVLDTDTREGQRVESWLMIRERGRP